MTKRLTIFCLIVLMLVTVIAVLIPKGGLFVAEINDTVKKLSNDTFNLIIYTDVHHDRKHVDPEDPYIEMLDNVAEICKRIRIDSIWNLGDIINGFDTTKAEAIAEILDVTSYEDKISQDVHRVLGNHDNNIQSTYEGDNGYPLSEVLSLSELNELLENSHSLQKEVHSARRPTDYYVDFDDLRVVCISADETAFQAATADWLKREALKTSSPVLILSHIPTRPEWGFHNDVKEGGMIEEALREFIDRDGTIVCYIHGHDHGDMISTVVNERGEKLWNEVAIGCTRFHVPKSNGTPGMTFWERNSNDETMLLFDVVSIDKQNRVVKFTRFGAGIDREVHF